MPLPSSGEIKVSQINTELGRTSNTANSNFAGGTTPQSGSLFKLGEAGGVNQTAPHAMSEWYGYNAVHLVYQSSITKGSGYPTYSSSSVWTNTYPSNEGIDCSDTLALSASPSNISTSDKSTIIIFTIEDFSGLNYFDAFDLYFYRTISSNDDIKVAISTAYFNSFGFLTYGQTRTIANYDTNLSGNTASVSFSAGTLSSPNVYLIFHLNGQDATNSATVSFSDINTRENCPV